jgi:hypothetical protein
LKDNAVAALLLSCEVWLRLAIGSLLFMPLEIGRKRSKEQEKGKSSKTGIKEGTYDRRDTMVLGFQHLFRDFV